MSDRGSWVTEYIYCSKCFEAVKRALQEGEPQLGAVSPANVRNSEKDHPILAGFVSELGAGEEADVFDFEFRENIERSICHSVRFAVLCESGRQEFFTMEPVEK